MDITISSTLQLPDVQALARRRAPDAVSIELRDLVQRHFLSLPPNAQGFTSSSFWGHAANATFANPTGDGRARVSVKQQGVRYQVEGGTIKPGPGKQFLAFPAADASYGHLAREYEDDPDYYFGRAFNPSIGRDQAAILKKSAGTHQEDGQTKPGLAWFWLAKSAHGDPHPEDLPSESDIRAAAESALSDLFDRVLAEGKN